MIIMMTTMVMAIVITFVVLVLCVHWHYNFVSTLTIKRSVTLGMQLKQETHKDVTI